MPTRLHPFLAYGSVNVDHGNTFLTLIPIRHSQPAFVTLFFDTGRIERAPTHPPSLSTKRPNPVRMVWSTLWEKPLPPGNFRSQAGFHSGASTRRLDSEHTSLYMGEM